MSGNFEVKHCEFFQKNITNKSRNYEALTMELSKRRLKEYNCKAYDSFYLSAKLLDSSKAMIMRARSYVDKFDSTDFKLCFQAQQCQA